MPAIQSIALTARNNFSEADIERRLKLVGLDTEDKARIATIRDIVVKAADEFTAAFFDHLGRSTDLASMFRGSVMEDARRQKRDHLMAMVSGQYGKEYVDQRLNLGRLYSAVGMDVPVFLGAFHHMLRAISDAVMKASREPAGSFQAFLSLQKVGFLDIGVIVDVLIDERERIIGAQQDAIRELSTPVLQVRNGLLILPIIGVLDSQRAKQLTDSLLHSIRANRARVVVMDITGVVAVDSKVANHLIQTVAAARLMGATVIITGLSADVAQALVALGVDLSKVNTVGDLQGGLEEAEEILGYRNLPSAHRSEDR
ncbi:MAG TPA: protoglobin domain-containing protein [Dongiaceae bacterium]|nr:protoglobin domain-containing protein [Dongiaceae bacterium]